MQKSLTTITDLAPGSLIVVVDPLGVAAEIPVIFDMYLVLSVEMNSFQERNDSIIVSGFHFEIMSELERRLYYTQHINMTNARSRQGVHNTQIPRHVRFPIRDKDAMNGYYSHWYIISSMT